MADYRTPGLAPRFQREQDDLNLSQQVPREAMDNEYNRVLHGADAGPLSTGSRRAQAQERNSIYGLRDQANRAAIFSNRAAQNISDRDLQWQGMQQDRQWQHGLMDRQMAAQEDQTKYLRGRDTINDAKGARQEQLSTALAMMSSPDPATRIRGEDMHDSLINGGSTGSAQAAAAVPAMEPGAQYNAGVTAPGAAPANSPRMAQYLKERDAQLAHQAELDRQQSRSADADFQERQFANSEKRHDKQTGDKLAMFKLRLDRTKNPNEVTNIMNQMAGVNASLAPMVNEPKGMMGVGDAVGGALKSAYGTADQAGQAAARNTFTTDPLEQAQYEAQQKRGLQTIGQQGGFADVADAQKVLQSDPQVSNAVGSLKAELASMASPSWGVKALNAIDSLSTLGLGTTQYQESLSRLPDAKVQELAAKVRQVAESAAARYPGVSADALHQIILTQLGGTLQSDNFDPTRRQQFSDTLYTTPKAAMPAANPSAGSKFARFMRLGGDVSPGGMQ